MHKETSIFAYTFLTALLKLVNLLSKTNYLKFMKTERKRICHILLCTFLLFMFTPPMISYAAPMDVQQGTITVRGTVIDKTGEPLIGVSVAVKGTSTGTITDLDGNYSINVANQDVVLAYSYIGYATQEIKVGNQTSINVTLSEDENVLDEVVVVGYGVQKKVNLTGSVSSVSADKIANRPATNLTSSLAGLAPGVRITQSSGNPGSEDVKINIRGTGSINASNPLILVDGIEGDMTVVNPDDVESISILKDAASAAIYGSRAASGVILVTTKKGKKEKPTVTFSALFAQEKAVSGLKFLSNSADWMTLHNTAVTNNNPGAPLRYQQTAIEDFRAADANPNGIYTNPVNGNQIPNWLAYPNTDWAQEMFQPAFYHRYNLSVSGGSDTSTYLLSASFQENPGSLENTGLQRFNIRANVETKVNDYLTIGTQTWATKEFKEPGNTSMTYLYQAAPTIVPKHNGLYGVSEDPAITVADNVLYSIASTGGEREYTRINTTWYANAKLWKGLSFEAKFNYNEYQRQDNTYSQNMPRYRFRQGTDEPVSDIGDLSKATTTRYSYFSRAYTADLILRYMATFGDHDISAFAAYEQYYYQRSGFRLRAQGLLDWDVNDINSAGSMLDWGTDKEKKDDAKKQLGILSYFGRVNYAYKGKYLFEANLRADGSSRFAPGHQWGVFPSFSAGWRISEEPFFLPAKDYVDNLKLKASYGTLGNQVGDYYDWQSIYAKVNNAFGGSIQNGVIQDQLPNYFLSWEKSTTLNVGFESNMLNQRLSLEFDYFRRNTTSMLVEPPKYITAGNVKMPKSNDAEMTARGFEINLGWQDKINNFRYSAGINLAYSTNEVTKYRGDLTYKADDGILDVWGKNPTWRYTNLADVSSNSGNKYILEGHMANEFYLRRRYSGDGSYSLTPNGGPKDGIIRTKADLDWVKAMIAEGYSFNGKTVGHGAANIYYGDMIFADLNGDGRFGSDDDREFTGKSEIPKWVFGINLFAEWKGIDLSMTWSGRLGSYHYILERGVNSNILSNERDAIANNALNLYYSYDATKSKADPNYDPATDPTANINGKYPRLLDRASTMQPNNFYLYNTSYLKLKNLQIGYTFPKKLINKARLNNLRVFVTAENLLTIKAKGYPGVDPELGGSINVYALPRVFSGGLTVNF